MNKIAPPSKNELQALRDSGASRADMAEEYGVSLSRMKRWISDLSITPRPSKQDPAKPEREKAAVILPITTGLSLMERCQKILGRRMGEDHRGYLLDGRPASSAQILRAAHMSGQRTTVSFT
jgi:hypothetical protein